MNWNNVMDNNYDNSAAFIHVLVLFTLTACESKTDSEILEHLCPFCIHFVSYLSLNNCSAFSTLSSGT